MHQGTSNCGTATTAHFLMALGYCMLLLPPIYAFTVVARLLQSFTLENVEVPPPSHKKG